MSAKNKILEYMKKEAYKPLTASELAKDLDIGKKEYNEFTNLLDTMEQEGLIIKTEWDRYGIPERMNMVVGRIESHSKGFAFLLPRDPQKEDVYISFEDRKGAMHNDLVVVVLLKGRPGIRREGEVYRILERANKTVVGNFEFHGDYGFVLPDDQRIQQDIFVSSSNFNGARKDQKVVVEIIEWPQKNRNPEGEIVEILGYKDDPETDLEGIIYEYGLDDEFPTQVINQARNISDQIPAEEIAEREDLRSLPMVTIDGEDAKDFDDAVSIEDKGEFYRLGVHIADVSHYVRPSTPLDQEAQNRSTSVYLMNKVIPMLPEKLSNNICSLKAGEDRLSVTVFMDFNKEGERIDYEILKSVIRVDARMTYSGVQDVLEGNKVDDNYDFYADKLFAMNELRKRLRRKRRERGSVDFNFPEPVIELDDNHFPISVKARKRAESHRLIEEFMLAANETVAEDIYWRELPFLYRVHEEPDSAKIRDFAAFIHNLDYSLQGVENIHPRALQEILEEARGEPEERIINTVLLRSMKQACYHPVNIGHFGLASRCYTHFTSPIRRYPDLVVHRIIKEVHDSGNLSQNWLDELKNNLPNIAEETSLLERNAEDAERALKELKMVEFMQDKVGQEFPAIISGIISFGLFVELENLIEGLVHVSSLDDDYYQFDEDNHILIGERTGNIFRIGDKVRVKVWQVNREEKKIDFVLEEKLET